MNERLPGGPAVIASSHLISSSRPVPDSTKAWCNEIVFSSRLTLLFEEHGITVKEDPNLHPELANLMSPWNASPWKSPVDVLKSFPDGDHSYQEKRGHNASCF